MGTETVLFNLFIMYIVNLQLLLQSAHDVESRKVKEIEKLNRQVRFLTSEEAANLVSTLRIKDEMNFID